MGCRNSGIRVKAKGSKFEIPPSKDIWGLSCIPHLEHHLG